MKTKITLFILTMLVASGAYAGNTASCPSCGVDVDVSSEAQANNDGNKQTINNYGSEIPTDTTQRVIYSGSTTQNVISGGTQKIKNVPGLGGLSLTSSNDTCMGSTSGGAAVAGFGFNIGSTWTDKNCTMLKNSRELWNMGMRAASLARMCMDADNKEALELTGFVCPTKKEDK
jgi:hypothetical protein